MKSSSSKASGSHNKPKKSSKDREKRKSSASSEKTSDHQSENGSISRDVATNQDLRIGPDSVGIYSEQSISMVLLEDVCNSFAEDLSYKLWLVIHDALIKAHLSGRNHILSRDIDLAFDNFSISRVLGATRTPNWVPFENDTLTYLDDPAVDLVEVAEGEINYNQARPPKTTRIWLTDYDVSKPLKSYFETMCPAVISNDFQLRQAALKDIRTNNLIGPIVEWFYRFGYLLLSKDSKYDTKITHYALDLIRTLEESNVGPLSVTEKQITLVVKLLLQKLLYATLTPEALNLMCSVLALICDRLPLFQMMHVKISMEITSIKLDHSYQLLCVINALGPIAIEELLVENTYLDYFLCRVDNDGDKMLASALLNTYRIMRHLMSLETHKKFYNVFWDKMSPFWRIECSNIKVEKPELNWKNVKGKLLKMQKKYYPLQPSRMMSTRSAFSEHADRFVDRKPMDKQFYLLIGPRCLRQKRSLRATHCDRSCNLYVI